MKKNPLPQPVILDDGTKIVPVGWATKQLEVTLPAIYDAVQRKKLFKFFIYKKHNYLRFPDDLKTFWLNFRPAGKSKERREPIFENPFPEKPKTQSDESSESLFTSNEGTHQGNAAERKSVIQTKTLLLQYRERLGELIDAKQAKFEWETIAISIRKGMLSISDRLAPILAGEKDSDKVHRILNEEITHVLENLESDAR